MAGRPKYKQDTEILAHIAPSFAAEIYSRIEQGSSIWKVAEFAGVSKSALSDWLEAADRIELYKRARIRAASRLAEATIEIADGQGKAASGTDGDAPAESDVARDKLRIQARQWIASRWDRETYGERANTQVTVNMATLHIDALRRARQAQQPPAASDRVVEAE